MMAEAPTFGRTVLSIDQNCHSLWDTVPKLHALAARGLSVRHFIEDVDAAFAAPGATVDAADLRLAKERFHRSGGADWGPALFYSEFLGRLPVEIRDWEPLTGMKTTVLARQLGRSVDDLYDEFSPGDNWQLIGSSYAGDRNHHRIIADLSVAETAPFIRELVRKAKADMERAFPERPSRRRLAEWFGREESRLERLLARCAGASLVELYRNWMAEYLPDSAELDLASRLFAHGAETARSELLEVFLKDYDLAAGLYNEAIAETASKLRPLQTAEGELPFFATLEYHRRAVRTGVFVRGGEILVGGRAFKLRPGSGKKLPVDELAAAGIRCLPAKAVLLVIQVRTGPNAAPLALPYRGSLYMPTAHRLADKLRRCRLLPGRLHPIVRVRFRLLDRLRSLRTVIRLPEHLAGCFGGCEIPASRLGENYAPLAAAAAERLESFKDPAFRQRWQRERFPRIAAEMEELDRQRRRLAGTEPKSQQIRQLWKQVKALQIKLLDGMLRQIATDYQLRDIDYWDSRGALLPWSIALGGEPFYNALIRNAGVYEEPSCPEGRNEEDKDHPEPL